MDDKKKLALLEEMMDLEDGTLSPEMSLDDVDEWDSLSALSFVVLMKDEFNKKVGGAEVRAFESVQDMLAMMEA